MARSISLAVALSFVVTTSSAFSLLHCNSPKPPAPKVAEEKPDESWVVDAGAKKEAPPAEAKAEDEGPGLPELKLRDSSLIESSVDYTGAVLIINEKARLIVPEGAIQMGTILHFGFGKSARKGPARIGKTYEIAPALQSVGAPFVLELPLPRGRKSASFAVSRVERKGGSERLVWDVVAATRIDEERRLAVLELAELPEGWIHLTAKAAK